MTDRPIIFSAPMVRAIFEGRKTQTRRLITPGTCTVLGSRVTAKSPAWAGLRFDLAVARAKGPLGTLRPHLAVPWVHPDDETHGVPADATYRVDPIIEAGDRLYVRERAHIDGREVNYAADQLAGMDLRGLNYRPSIHMPRWASRLTLVVTEVRVERLNAMSPADAIAEGIQDLRTPDHSDFGIPGLVNAQHPVRAFWLLWDDINGEGSWETNPWVAAITFEVQRQNIDALSEVAA